MIEISTKTKKNLDKLIDSIILQAEILDLKTEYETEAKGIVLESKIDIGQRTCSKYNCNLRKFKKRRLFCKWKKMGQSKSYNKRPRSKYRILQSHQHQLKF